MHRVSILDARRRRERSPWARAEVGRDGADMQPTKQLSYTTSAKYLGTQVDVFEVIVTYSLGHIILTRFTLFDK
jgi:hypothetical protein